ncbi:MAG: TolC family protein [Planctomycetota bacterium]
MTILADPVSRFDCQSARSISLIRVGKRSLPSLGLLLAFVICCGCSRRHYRTRADQQVRAILEQKRCEEACTLPPLPGIEVDPRSRFYDPSPRDCPALPDPVPRLMGYELPRLATGDPGRARIEASQADQDELPSGEAANVEVLPAGPGEDEMLPTLEPPSVNPPDTGVLPAPQSTGLESTEVEPVQFQQTLPGDWESVGRDQSGDEVRLAVLANPSAPANREVRLAEMIESFATRSPGPTTQSLTDEMATEDSAATATNGGEEASEQGLRIVPIPDSFWGELPESCLPRMLEFESVRQEFRRSYPDASVGDLESLLSDSPRLTLPMIMELASLNSRELQFEKERLYLAALALTAERYEYLLRPTRRGNGTAVDYSYERVNGTSETGLGIGNGVAVQKTTAMAGQFLASFANDVVLTFNGPQGFFADVSSALVFDFQQTIFQRDRVFEGLTQAERDVVYAARDYIAFRRALFVELASRYYNLLLTYRGIEISSQDYFSNTRAFLQGRAEYFRSRIPRVQVDQFEQNALRSRSNLVRDCNSLETSLDRLKLDIGLPPEMPLNLNLDELEALTASDELTVTQQLVLRTKQSLIDATEQLSDDRDAAVINATVLVNRLIDTLRVRRKLEGADEDSEAVRRARIVSGRLALLDARLRANQLREILDLETSEGEQTLQEQLKRFSRTSELISVRLEEIERAIELREISEGLNPRETRERTRRVSDELESLLTRFQTSIDGRQFDQLDTQVRLVDDLLDRTQALEAEVVADLLPEGERELEALLQQLVDESLQLVDSVMSGDTSGLDEVNVDEEDAMMLALIQRLDLANVRGDLADSRRQVKLNADDLRAILDLRVQQSLRARRLVSDTFDVRSDGATTRLSFALDTPLNRRIERNNYRASLINYDRARRTLINQEDTIKFGIRENLRQLRLQRDQYEISVAQAALAFERVVSTRLQLQLSIGNVVARDFLEAQQDYTSALNSVASDHISFILDRIDLFLNTESIRLNETLYWESTQEDRIDLPTIPDFSDANPNPWGRLPPCLDYSDEVRQNH